MYINQGLCYYLGYLYWARCFGWKGEGVGRYKCNGVTAKLKFATERKNKVAEEAVRNFKKKSETRQSRGEREEGESHRAKPDVPCGLEIIKPRYSGEH
jgi:hypothetical protein